jgi:hypothetical protein
VSRLRLRLAQCRMRAVSGIKKSTADVERYSSFGKLQNEGKTDKAKDAVHNVAGDGKDAARGAMDD